MNFREKKSKFLTLSLIAIFLKKKKKKKKNRLLKYQYLKSVLHINKI